ncbi:hypothetical protein J6590_036244 [Homalodisca vitripennis]|nr:hypothetical protein J6590_036244 [Homalodisca vitripennis]
MSQHQFAGYLSKNGLKWTRTKPVYSPYSLDRRPQLSQGKRPHLSQWTRPQLLPRKPQAPIPPRAARKWRRKDESKAEDDTSLQEEEETDQSKKPESQEEDVHHVEKEVFKRPCYTDRFISSDEED